MVSGAATDLVFALMAVTTASGADDRGFTFNLSLGSGAMVGFPQDLEWVKADPMRHYDSGVPSSVELTFAVGVVNLSLGGYVRPRIAVAFHGAFVAFKRIGSGFGYGGFQVLVGPSLIYWPSNRVFLRGGLLVGVSTIINNPGYGGSSIGLTGGVGWAFVRTRHHALAIEAQLTPLTSIGAMPGLSTVALNTVLSWHVF